jgi:hypothetical protein
VFPRIPRVKVSTDIAALLSYHLFRTVEVVANGVIDAGRRVIQTVCVHEWIEHTCDEGRPAYCRGCGADGSDDTEQERFDKIVSQLLSKKSDE